MTVSRIPCCFLLLASLIPASADDWSKRLAEPDAAAVAASAVSQGEVEPFLKALSEATDPAVADRYGAFVLECLPGGRRAAKLSADGGKLAMNLAAKSKIHRPQAFFRLARIQDLSTGPTQQAAHQAMKSVPTAEWPVGFESYLAEPPKPIDPAILAKGKEVYHRPGICVTCHQPDGKGLPSVYPPIAGTPWLKGKPDRVIKIALKGMIGPVNVLGQDFNSAMTPLESLLNDEELAAVLTYVRNEWGHKESAVTPEQVKATREALKDRAFFTAEEVLKLHPLGE